MGNMARQLQNPDYSDDEYGAEEAYFTYRPLSNLPTPPPSSRNTSTHQSPKTGLEDGEVLQEKFLGMYYVTLFPPLRGPPPRNTCSRERMCSNPTLLDVYAMQY